MTQLTTLHFLSHALKTFCNHSDNTTLCKDAELNNLLIDGLILNLREEKVKQVCCHTNLSTHHRTSLLCLSLLFYLFLTTKLFELINGFKHMVMVMLDAVCFLFGSICLKVFKCINYRDLISATL